MLVCGVDIQPSLVEVQRWRFGAQVEDFRSGHVTGRNLNVKMTKQSWPRDLRCWQGTKAWWWWGAGGLVGGLDWSTVTLHMPPTVLIDASLFPIDTLTECSESSRPWR